MDHRLRGTVPLTTSLLVLAAALVVGAAPARADDTCTTSWTGGAGVWSDAAHWSTGTVPTPTDAVCIIGAQGAAPVSVRVTTSVSASMLTLRGATLRVVTDATVSAPQFSATAATVTGGGTVLGASSGWVTLTDSRLDGVHVRARAGLRLAGRVAFSGGATAVQTGEFGGGDMADGTRVVDLDGTRNHLQFQRFPLYLTGSVSVGVPLGLVDLALFAQGRVTLSVLDNLGADGWLRPLDGTTSLQLGASITGSLQLARPIKAIAPGVGVFAPGVTTPDGGNALAALQEVDGSLNLGQPLFVPGPLTIGGTVASTSSLGAGGITVTTGGNLLMSSTPDATVYSDVTVLPGAHVTAQDITGALVNRGSVDLGGGAHVGRLALLPSSRTTTDLRQPVRVDHRATLAGALDVRLPRGRLLPPAGTELVLLTAPEGVRGTFDRVDVDQPQRAALQLGYQTTWVTGVVTAPV